MSAKKYFGSLVELEYFYAAKTLEAVGFLQEIILSISVRKAVIEVRKLEIEFLGFYLQRTLINAVMSLSRV